MWSWGQLVGDAEIFDGDYTRTYLFGGQLAGTSPEGNNLKPEELWNIDTKMDDGRPATGQLVSRNWNTSCVVATSGADTNATYNLTNSALACHAVFRGMF
jgi:hypothetical protein